MYQKQKKDPLSIVIKSPKTVFDPFAFGDGDETIMFFLEFDSYFDTSSIKSEIITYKKSEWMYLDGVPTPYK